MELVRRNDNEKIIDLVASCVIQVDKLVSFLPSIIPQCIYSHDCLEIRLQACPRKNNELIPNRHLQKSANVTTNNFAQAYSRFAFSSTNYGQNCKVYLCIEYKIYFSMVRVSYWIKHSVDKKTKINGKWIMTRITISLKWKTH